MLLTALTVGLLGGVHCLGMCGGVVSALTLRRVAGPARLA
ncbi:MAG: sulfite exporter TauE/SafE family protein, partial [Proteobacteria bacterium]|nr:sulfite exporter TauE/SafE family protein [Pseudomonadota bacterium]